MNHPCFQSPPKLVGINSRLEAIKSLLNLEKEGVQIVAICGMRGIGKTTVAKTIYDEIGRFFRFRAFSCKHGTSLESSQHGLLKLLPQPLSKIMNRCKKIYGSDEEADMIKQHCCGKNTLLVIDDVSDRNLLEEFAGAWDSFGPGSKIIVTTADESLLESCKEMIPYVVPRLTPDEARELFTSKAFEGTDEAKAHEEIIQDTLKYAKGHPLVITVLGGLFRSKPQNEWRSALELLKSCPPGDIVAPLRKIYDNLHEYEQITFLDIACFLKGQPERHVRNILTCCGLHPDAVMGPLQRKYLINIENKKVDMPDWLQEMGRGIVRAESSSPGKQSRLWDPQEIRDILVGETVRDRIRGIKIDDPEAVVALSEKAFKTLERLRLFLAYRTQYSGNPIKFPKTLRCLEWEGYSSSSLPLNGSADWELVGLYMRESKIEQIRDELKLFRKLRFLYLSKSALLRNIPDLSSLPMLEILDAEGCTALEEVHQSLGELTQLVCLNFLNCPRLHSFPHSLRSTFLKELTLKNCLKLARFPNIHNTIDKLEQLSLHKTAIDALPPDIENLIGLRELFLNGCIRLVTLPKSIYRLQSLQRVSLDGCCQLDKFPEYADENSSSLLPKVVCIDLQGCSLGNIDFMRNLDCTSTLKRLDLSGNKLIAIPEFLGNFSALEELRLENCKQLRDIHGLPPNIKNLHAEGCESLVHCVSLSRFLFSESVNSSHWFGFAGCYKLRQGDSSVAICPSIEDLTLKPKINILHPGSEIPKWFTSERQSKEGFISFSVNSEEYKNFAGLALCMIIGEQSRKSSCHMRVDINKKWAYDSSYEFKSLGSDHIWFIYVPCCMITGWDVNTKNWCNKFEVTFEESWSVLKRCGVHLVLKKDRQAIQTINQLDHYASDMDHQSHGSLAGLRRRDNAMEVVPRPNKKIRSS